MSLAYQNSAGSRTRSTNGCWTCRLRKKKCDETRPLCLACESLGIDCHGYDRRPSWMDKGWRQREEVERIKAKISKRSWKKAADRQTLESSSSSPPMPRDGIEKTNTWPHDAGMQVDSTSPRADSRAGDGQVEMNESDGNEALRRAFEDFNSLMSPFSFESSEMPFDELVAGLPVRNLDDAFAVVGGLNFDSFKEYPPLPTPGQDHDIAPSIKDPRDTTTPVHSSVEPTRMTPTTIATVSTRNVQHGPLLGPSTSHEGPSAEESSMLAYFVDNISAIQFPFHCSQLSGNTELGWLHYLLFRSSAARRVTVALAGAYQASIDDLNDSQLQTPHLTISRHVLTELPSGSSAVSLLDHDQKVFQLIETCFCYLQNLLLETLQGRLFNWAPLLRKVAPAVRSLIDLTAHLFQISQSEKRRSVHKSHFSAVRIILAYLVWFHMQTTTLGHKDSLLGVDQHQVITLCPVEIERVSGCHDWILSAICDIMDLSAWRTQAEDQGRLSLFELVQRGNIIFKTIDRNLDREEDNSSETPASKWSQDPSQLRGKNAITAVFAYAAMTYLHVIISGPNPHLTEIKGAVSQAVTSLRALTVEKTSANLIWPICVVGCMAEGEERVALQDCITKLNGMEQSPHSLQSVFRIVHDCWKARDEGRDCEWSVIINQMMPDWEEVAVSPKGI